MKTIEIIVLIIFIAVAIFAFFAIKKVEEKRGKSKAKKLTTSASPKLKIKLPYLSKSEVKFLAVFQNSLPSEYVAFPRVQMSDIVKPDGSLIIFQEIQHEVLDVVVFLKTKMQPVLIVDLYDPSKGEKALEKYNEFTEKALKSVGLPVLTVTLDHDFEKVELLNAFLDKMDPVSIAQLKK